MKRKSIFILPVLMTILLAAGQVVFSQQGMGRGNGWGPGLQNRIPNLTDDQTKQITDLQTAHTKTMTDLRNQLSEKTAHLRTLNSADSPDMKAINSTIDEIGALNTDMMKEREAYIQKVRGLLTADQKAAFDSSPMHRMGQRNFGKGNGYGRYGYGRGMGRGMGYGYGHGYFRPFGK